MTALGLLLLFFVALAGCQASGRPAGTSLPATEAAPAAGGGLAEQDRPSLPARSGLDTLASYTPTLRPEPQDAPGPNSDTASHPPDRIDASPEPASPSPYAVEVSLAEQRVRVYRDGQLIREMVASTGTPDKPTPTGFFRLQNRGEWFYSEKYQQGAKWWVSFKDWGVYLFHSVPMDRQKRIIPEEAAKLGQPASHGCVRLSVEDARWFYETLPAGTPVHIY